MYKIVVLVGEYFVRCCEADFNIFAEVFREEYRHVLRFFLVGSGYKY